MSTSTTEFQIQQLRRDARRAQKANGTRLGIEQDLIARKKGFASWSMLVRTLTTAAAQIVLPGVVFSRTPEEMRIAMRKPKGWEYWSDRDAESVRSRLKDYSTEFRTSREALEFAIAYMQCLLQVPRFYLHTASTVYFEMRSWLPYCVQEDADDPSFRIFVGRDYKPVGMVQRENRVDYKHFPQLQVQIDDKELASLSPATDTHSSAHLYGHSPWHSRANAEAYLQRLVRLREWLALNGR